MKKSVYRIILIIAGLLHVLSFFAVPYATLDGLAGSLGQLAGALGAGDLYPGKLTGLNVVKQASLFGDYASLLIVLALIPFFAGLLVALFNFFGKKRLSYIGTILISIIGAGSYGILNVAMEDYKQLGYNIGVTLYVLIALSVIQIIVAIIGCVKDKSSASAKGGKDKNVKVGKKDGSITGVRGSYVGAVIPVKTGANVIIGRDPAVSSVVVKDEKASRKHCEIAFNAENGMYAVTDYSVNGTFDRDGNRLPEKVAVPMSAGSEIRISKDGDIFRLG